MSLDITRQAAALIDHIQTRFHNGHRRAIAKLLTMAGHHQEAQEGRQSGSNFLGEMTP
jgi:iron-sulfur cluster repair protein YtfE (RIC family)